MRLTRSHTFDMLRCTGLLQVRSSTVAYHQSAYILKGKFAFVAKCTYSSANDPDAVADLIASPSRFKLHICYLAICRRSSLRIPSCATCSSALPCQCTSTGGYLSSGVFAYHANNRNFAFRASTPRMAGLIRALSRLIRANVISFIGVAHLRLVFTDGAR